MKKNAFRSLLCLSLPLVFVGCGKVESPHFVLNMVALDQAQVPRDKEREVADVLEAMFGTPDEPFVLAESGLDIKKVRMAAGPVRSDEFGKETGLYRRHCGHCHGTTGDGMGPTALLLNPYPRDYRQGIFKFKSTEFAAKPTDGDLEKVLRHGVAGTAMPSFDLLPDAQVKALVEYVKYLSIRGQTELRLINTLSELGEDEKLQIDRSLLVDDILAAVATPWAEAKDKVIAITDENARPDMPLAESVALGKELFYGTRANCKKCHGPSALGDGQTNDYDDWNKPIAEIYKKVAETEKALAEDKDMSSEERSETKTRLAQTLAILHSDALPPRNIIPRNLRQGVYRGGRRPVDIYRRIYAGIRGVPMPGVGPTSPGAEGTLKSDEIWHLVDYVQSLPLEPIGHAPRPKASEFSQSEY